MTTLASVHALACLQEPFAAAARRSMQHGAAPGTLKQVSEPHLGATDCVRSYWQRGAGVHASCALLWLLCVEQARRAFHAAFQ